MVRLGMLMLLSLAFICTGCSKEPVRNTTDAGTPWISPHGIRAENDPDTLEYLMAVQRFQHENGRLPRPEDHLNW